MNKRSMLMATGIAAVALIASACSIDIERNADGSLQVEGVITEQSLAAELERDPQNENVTVDIVDGSLAVTADHTELDGSVHAIAFRADLGVADGSLTVEVSEATWDGFPIPQSFVDQFNAELARAIERAARQHPDASLVAVSMTGDEVSFEWRIETPDSKGS